MAIAMPLAIEGMNSGQELSISTLIAGNLEELSGAQGRIEEEIIENVFDVYVHVGICVPPVFGVGSNGARLAVVGHKRDFAEAKYSDWARFGFVNSFSII